MSERLTPLLRRVLASLPVWHEDEDGAVQSELEEHGVSVRRHDLAEMVAQLEPNPHAQVRGDDGELRGMVPAEVERCLDWLVGQGWAAFEDVEHAVTGGETGEEQPRPQPPVRYWWMTEEGFAAIHAPDEEENQVPGPVTIEPDAAEVTLSTEMEA